MGKLVKSKEMKAHMFARLYLIMLGLFIALNEITLASKYGIFDSKYFYINEFREMWEIEEPHRLASILYRISTSPIGEIVKFFLVHFENNKLLLFCLLTLSLGFTGHLLYNFLTDLLPKSVSVMFITVILLSPARVSLHELLFSKHSRFEYSAFFGSVPVPVLTLLGFSVILNFSRSLFRSSQFPLKTSIYIFMLAYLLHPVLVPIFILVVWSNLFIRSSRSFWSSKIEKNFRFMAVATFLIIVAILIPIFSSKQYLGSLTLTFNFSLSFFNLVVYFLFPSFFLIVAMLTFNISASELYFKFYPILIIFVFESGLQLLSIIVNRDLLVTFRFHGLTYAFHVLYYAPVFYVLVSRRILFLHRINAKVIGIFEKYLVKLISIICVGIVTLSFSRIWVLRSSDNINPACVVTTKALEENLAGFSKVPDGYVVKALVDFGLANLSTREFNSFMATPFGDVNETNECGYKGLGFLILNGFRFDEYAIRKAQLVISIYEGKKV